MMFRTCFLSSLYVTFYQAVANIPADQTPGQSYMLTNQSEKDKRCTACCIFTLLSFLKFCSAFGEEKTKTSQPIKGCDSHLCWQIGNTNLKKDVEYLHSSKFCQISFSSCREDKMSQPTLSFLTDQSEKHKLDRVCWVLASCQVSSNSVLQLQVKDVSANQRTGCPSLLTERPEKQLGTGCWVFDSF